CLCTGYPLIGNIDDDPHPEIVFLEKQESWQPMYIYCWRYTTPTGLTTVWQHQHDDSSGQTGITLFDFNQDDIMELVYRDSENLRIINGSGKSHITGNDTIRPYNIYARMMAAGTGCEYPIVADVNGDGSAEIVVSGMLDQYANLPGVGGLHMFGNPGKWAPARPVWNQYMYHVTNVNEDLTIPTYCFDKATVFTGSDGTIRRPYNNFLQQAGYITPQGEPYNPGDMVEIEHYGEGCDTYTFHGVTYTASGDYEYLIENPLGCDTLLNLHVHLGDTIHNYLYKAACDSYTWNGTTYTESGIYEQTFTSAQGCDSIVILDLTIGASSYVSPIHPSSRPCRAGFLRPPGWSGILRRLSEAATAAPREPRRRPGDGHLAWSFFVCV
ncbi:MAG: VCBS repeat-containing protein, partial [Bacteroidales bacterium]|nr:VCBS repeat-containing protein [Bacteroidales bacterium]